MIFRNWFSRHKLVAYNPAWNVIPAWAGIVHRDFDRDGYYYAPLVLNIILRWALSVWRYLQAGYLGITPFELGRIVARKPGVCSNCIASYTKGHEAGRQQANRTARKEGYDIAMATAEEEMLKAHNAAAQHQEELIDLALMMAVTR